MTEISNITNDFNINIELDTDYKDYYYYPSNQTKIEVRYRKTERGIEKIRKVFRLEYYPASIARKIKERQKWAKFGAAKDQTESVTSIGDDVEIELTPGLKFIKQNPNYNFNPGVNQIHPKIDFLLNTKYYLDNSENNINSETIAEISKNYKNQNFQDTQNTQEPSDTQEASDTQDTSDSLTQIEFKQPQINQIDLKQLEVKQIDFNQDKDNKKSIVNCRNCGSSEHWSIKCPMLEYQRKQKEELEELHKRQEEQHKQEAIIKAKKEKDNLIGIKVSDFDTDISEQQLRDHFKQFGNIHHFYNVKNKKNGKPMGTIYITYATQEENDRALIEIPRKNIGYIYPSVEIAKPKNY